MLGSMFELTAPPTAQLLPREARLVHNGRWHLLSHGAHRKLGWGDLSLADLVDVRAQLRGGLFVVVREAANFDPLGDERWGHYDRMAVPDPTLAAADIAAQALFVVSVEAGVLERGWDDATVTGTPAAHPDAPIVLRYITTSDLATLIAAHGTRCNASGHAGSIRPSACSAVSVVPQVVDHGEPLPAD